MHHEVSNVWDCLKAMCIKTSSNPWFCTFCFRDIFSPDLFRFAYFWHHVSSMRNIFFFFFLGDVALKDMICQSLRKRNSSRAHCSHSNSVVDQLACQGENVQWGATQACITKAWFHINVHAPLAELFNRLLTAIVGANNITKHQRENAESGITFWQMVRSAQQLWNPACHGKARLCDRMLLL